MSDNNPGRWQNVKDEEVKVGRPIDDVDMLKLLGNQRHEYELLTNTAAGESQVVPGHNHGDVTGTAEDGFTRRTGGFGTTFSNGTTETAQWRLSNTSWTNLNLPIRCNVGNFRHWATELYYKVSANGVKFRVERWDWVDSGPCTDDGGTFGTNALQETTFSRSTSMIWKTVDGKRWVAAASTFSGDATKLGRFDGPTSITTMHEVGTDAEFKIFAAASTANTTLYIGALRIVPAKGTDEGTGEIFT